MPKNNLSKDLKDKILEMYSNGASQISIASTLGVSKMTVCVHVNPKVAQRIRNSHSTKEYKIRRRQYMKDRRKDPDWKESHCRRMVERRPILKLKVRRPYGGYCEICGIDHIKNPHWHHWDDKDLSRGLWLCFRCHFFVEGVEYGLTASHVNKYLDLRKEIGGDSLLKLERST